jgi:hypothetical protein
MFKAIGVHGHINKQSAPGLYRAFRKDSPSESPRRPCRNVWMLAQDFACRQFMFEA